MLLRNLATHNLRSVLPMVALCALGAAQTEWQRLPSMAPLHGCAMAYDSARGRVMMFGGKLASGEFSSDLWEWDGIAWILRPSTVLPPRRSDHALAYDSSRQRLVLFGGFGGTTPYSRLADTWEWDSSSWTEVGSASSPSARISHAMVYDPVRRRTVLFGGDGISIFADTWEWDGAVWARLTPSTSPSPRWGAGLVFDASRNRPLLFGGKLDYSLSTPASGETWDFDGATWRRLSTTGPARSHQAMFFDAARQQTALFGGWSGGTILGDTWVWNGQQWSLSPAVTNPSLRYLPGAAYDSARGRGVLFGGTDFGVFPPAETWEWDGSTWRVAHRAPDFARSRHVVAHDGSTVIAFGGVGTSGVLDDTLRFDGAGWTPAAPATRPPARADHSAASDTARQRAVVFGGHDGITLLDDTWEWDGTNWRAYTGAPRPSPRRSAAMAYDPRRQRIVLFGGESAGGTNDTWEYDGQAWTQRTPASSPQARRGAAMAFDHVRGTVILFGGMDVALPLPLNDTWAWDGTAWTQLRPSNVPAPRGWAAVAEDVARRRIVISNGVYLFNADTWEWDGSTWLQRAPAESPSPFVTGAAMAYHPRAGHSVWFGGSFGGPTSDTWIYGTTAPAAFTTHYVSCPSSVGSPRLTGECPWLGETFRVSIEGLPRAAPALTLLGFSATTLFGSIPLPLDMTFFGMTGCTLYTDIAVSLPMAVSNGVATWSMTLCACPNLIGTAFFCQGLAADPPANPAGLILTNAGAGIVGAK